MNAKILKGLTSGFIITLFLTPIWSVADSLYEQITAYLNPTIKIFYNGEEFVPKEADGTVVSPIIYNNRSYLPVKFVAEKLGASVDWNNETKAIILNQNKGIASSPAETVQTLPIKDETPYQEISFKNCRDIVSNLNNKDDRGFASVLDSDLMGQWKKGAKYGFIVQHSGLGGAGKREAFDLKLQLNKNYKKIKFDLGMTFYGYSYI